MTDQEKRLSNKIAKIVGLSLLGLIALFPAIGIWVASAKGFIASIFGVVGAINLIGEGYVIYKIYEYLFPKKDEETNS